MKRRLMPQLMTIVLQKVLLSRDLILFNEGISNSIKFIYLYDQTLVFHNNIIMWSGHYIRYVTMMMMLLYVVSSIYYYYYNIIVSYRSMMMMMMLCRDNNSLIPTFKNLIKCEHKAITAQDRTSNKHSDNTQKQLA